MLRKRGDERTVVPERPLAPAVEPTPEGLAVLAVVGEDRAGVVQLVARGHEPDGPRRAREVREVLLLPALHGGFGVTAVSLHPSTISATAGPNFSRMSVAVGAPP